MILKQFVRGYRTIGQDSPTRREHRLPVAHQATTWADLANEVTPIFYAWPGWLANGLVTMLAAESGTGKSALVLQLCTSFLTGAPWPDGSPFDGHRGKVLWCEAESAHAVNPSEPAGPCTVARSSLVSLKDCSRKPGHATFWTTHRLPRDTSVPCE